MTALPSGSHAYSFGVATNWQTAKGAGVEFHDVKFYSPSDKLAAHLVKGKQVSIEGRLKKETWEKDGEPRSRRVIVAYRLDLGSSPSGNPEVSAQGEDAPF